VSADWFVHPEWLDATILVALSAALAVALARLAASRRRRTLLGPAAPSRSRDLSNDAMLLVALAAIGLALLGPRAGERVESVPAEGVDVVFVVDVSRSMDARDVPPSRLDRTRRAAQEILVRLEPQDRAALAAFAGRGVLLTPLTPDRAALVELLAGLDTELIHPAASNLGHGVRAALAAFDPGSQRRRAMFVLSDGEVSRQLGAADAARARVRVLAAALGTAAGAPVPDHGVPLRDAAGAIVISRRSSERLAELAAATGGEVFAVDEWGVFDFDRAAASIRRDARATPGERIELRVPAVQVIPVAAIAFALLLVEGLPWRARFLRRGATAACLAAAALLTGAGPSPPADRIAEAAPGVRALEARLRARPHDAHLLVRLGLARLEHGEREAAARAFLAAAVYARDRATASLAYYDLGVTALEQGDLEGARDAFFDALALDPGQRSARFNLEWTLRALARRPPSLAQPLRSAEPTPRTDDGAPDSPEEDDAEADDRERVRRREPSEEAEPSAYDANARQSPVPLPLSDAQRRRWLERVEDDPRRSIRTSARQDRRGASRRRSPGGPVW
jgi:Ca-activated chloride channel family protein